MLDWSLPYPASRSPVFARNLVATSQPLATQAGVEALAAGGNAVDAALAAAITLTVVEPNNNGIGSDAFALIWDGKDLRGLNASGRSPATLDPADFTGEDRMPIHGWNAVTVPGAVSAWVELSRHYGKLPFTRLFERAIHYAEQGYAVGPKTAPYWRLAVEAFKDRAPFIETFALKGLAPEVGQTIKLPDHAVSLKEIAETRGESFYRGRLAECIAADAAQHGGKMTVEDLANHRCEWVEPISTEFAGCTLHEIPPNGQGLMALIAAGILRHTNVLEFALDSVDSVHLQVEAMRIAYANIARHLADIDRMQVASDDLLDDAFLAARADEINLQQANPSPTSLGAAADTVYLTAADAQGMMVSFIQSNYMGFGSGVVVPGTGISLQNRGAGFVLTEGHPNRVGGGKRPYHTIIPGFVSRDGEPLMSFGVMGGHMQAQGHLQMLIRVGHYGQNPQAASDAPRWHLLEDGRLALEDGFDSDVAAALAARGHQLLRGGPEFLFGGAQLIARYGDGYVAGSDHRKEGHAAGF